MVEVDVAVKEPYPWRLLGRTILILVSFLALGVVEVVRGPTLLDLKDLLGATVGETSFIFMLSSIGSVVGCFSVGLIMDKIIWLRYPVLALLLVVMGVCTCVFPYCPALPALYTAAFFAGLGAGALDTGSQVLLLDVWRGRDSGPYMHALHFMFGIGAFLAPVVARPFLINTEELSVHANFINSSNLTSEVEEGPSDDFYVYDDAVNEDTSQDLDVSNLLEEAKFFPPKVLDHRQLNSSLHLVAQIRGEDGEAEPTSVDYFPAVVYPGGYEAPSGVLDSGHQLTIKTLYPILGAFPLLISLGYIAYFLYDRRKAALPDGQVSATDKIPDRKLSTDIPLTKPQMETKRMILLVTMMIFFFLYAGLEVAFGTFITTFAVKCKLKLTRQQGSDIAAVFWGAFASMRALAVPAAIFLPPEIIMVFSFTACLVGSSLLSFLGDSSVVALYICSGVMGVGMASVYATGLLWLEKRVEITNKIGAAMTVSSSLGAKIFPVVVGQTVEYYPMSFMYIMLGISTGCTLLFGLNAVIGRQLPSVQGVQHDPAVDEDKELDVLLGLQDTGSRAAGDTDTATKREGDTLPMVLDNDVDSGRSALS